MKEVWFITGASKGLGAAMVRAALDAGHAVVAAARDANCAAEALGDHPDLLVCALDVTDPEQAAQAVGAAEQRFGRVDVLVNNAGYGLLGYFEELSEAQVRAQFETNLFGAMNVTRVILPVMRGQGKGWIVGVSSTSGARAVEGGSVYSASKFALEGWLEGLALDLAPFGIRCLILEPGAFRTEFLNRERSVAFAGDPLPAYERQRVALEERFLASDGRQAGDPEKLARALLTVLAAPEAPLRLLCGKFAVQSIAERLTTRLEQLEAWRAVSEGTDFE